MGSSVQDHPVETTITKLAGLEKNFLRDAHSENYTVNFETKISIGSNYKYQCSNKPKDEKVGKVGANGKWIHYHKQHLGGFFHKDKKGEDKDKVTQGSK